MTGGNVHVLDTSALSRLDDGGEAFMRHKVIAATRAGDIRVLATYPLVWEVQAARAADVAKYRSMIELLRALAHRQVLLALPERLRREISARRALEYPECLDVEREVTPFFDSVKLDEASAEHLRLAREAQEDEVREAGVILEGLKASEGGLADARRKLKRLRAEPEGYVLADSFAAKMIAGFGDGAPASSVPHRSLPSVWSRALILVARIHAVHVGGTSPDSRRSPKFLDMIHLGEAASYGDVFVTDDGPLRAFAATVRDLRCRVLRYDDWAANVV